MFEKTKEFFKTSPKLFKNCLSLNSSALSNPSADILFLVLKFGLSVYTGRPNFNNKNNISADGLDKADGLDYKNIQKIKEIIGS